MSIDTSTFAFSSWAERASTSLSSIPTITGESDSKLTAHADVYLKTAARWGLTSAKLMGFGIPQVFTWSGTGVSYARENSWQAGLGEMLLFAASMIPVWGSGVDLFLAVREIYRHGNQGAWGMHLASAVLGLGSHLFLFGRIVNAGKTARVMSNVKIAQIRLLEKMAEAAEVGKVIGGKGAHIYRQKLLGELRPAVKHLQQYAPSSLSRLKKSFVKLHQKGLPALTLGRMVDREILIQVSRSVKPWYQVGQLRYAPRAVYASADPLGWQSLAWIWLRSYNPAKVLNPLIHGISKSQARALVKLDYPRPPAVIESFQKDGKEFMKDLVMNLRKKGKFGKWFEVDPESVSEKGWESIKGRINEGKVLSDLSRIRLITKKNHATERIVRFLVDEYDAIPTVSLTTTKSLKSGRAYRAAHVVIPHPKGAVEVQIQGQNMNRWYQKDHGEFYKLKKEASPQHYQLGLRAFEADKKGYLLPELFPRPFG